MTYNWRWSKAQAFSSIPVEYEVVENPCHAVTYIHAMHCHRPPKTPLEYQGVEYPCRTVNLQPICSQYRSPPFRSDLIVCLPFRSELWILVKYRDIECPCQWQPRSNTSSLCVTVHPCHVGLNIASWNLILSAPWHPSPCSMSPSYSSLWNSVLQPQQINADSFKRSLPLNYKNVCIK